MSTKRNTVPELQRELLNAGIKHPRGRLSFAKASAETLATTYAALLSLQRKKLIEPEEQADPRMMSWKVTKAGKAAVADKPGRGWEPRPAAAARRTGSADIPKSAKRTGA